MVRIRAFLPEPGGGYLWVDAGPPNRPAGPYVDESANTQLDRPPFSFGEAVELLSQMED
jgi:hypothetical protein